MFRRQAREVTRLYRFNKSIAEFTGLLNCGSVFYQRGLYLIGATDFFVRAPFVIEGILIGVLGSVLPLAGLYIMYTNVLQFIQARFAVLSNLLHFIPVGEVFRTLLPVIVLMGVGIGFVGSFITVRKHLRV